MQMDASTPRPSGVRRERDHSGLTPERVVVGRAEGLDDALEDDYAEQPLWADEMDDFGGDASEEVVGVCERFPSF